MMCRSSPFNNVKIYCEQCFSSYHQTTLLEHMYTLDFEKQICDGCKESNMGNPGEMKWQP